MTVTHDLSAATYHHHLTTAALMGMALMVGACRGGSQPKRDERSKAVTANHASDGGAGEPVTLPCLCLRLDDDRGAELLYVDGTQAFEAFQPVPGEHERVSGGTTGFLILERKRGAVAFRETRITGWSVGEVEPATRQMLVAALHTFLTEAWETSEDADSSHTLEDREYLRRRLFVGQALGLDVDSLLTVTDYPLEDSNGFHHVHDVRAFSAPPETVARTIRLTPPTTASRL